MEYVHPHMLPNGEQAAMDRKLVTRRTTAIEDTDLQYVAGDLVTVVDSAGAATEDGLVKYTGSSLGRVGIAGRDWSQPFAKQYFLDKGEPVELIPEANEFVFSYQGATAVGTDHTFTAADKLAVEQGAVRNAEFDATAGVKCVTIRGGSGTANVIQVRLLRIFDGEVGDTNVRVVGRIERASLLS